MEAVTPTRDRRESSRPLSWAIAIVAFGLCLSGWFSVVGLAVAVLAMVAASRTRNRGAFILGGVAIGIASVWLLMDLLIS